METAVRESGRDGRPLPSTLSDQEVVDDDHEVQELVGDPVVPAEQAAVPAQVAVPEHTHPGESQSNGAAQRAMTLLKTLLELSKRHLRIVSIGSCPAIIPLCTGSSVTPPTC